MLISLDNGIMKSRNHFGGINRDVFSTLEFFDSLFDQNFKQGKTATNYEPLTIGYSPRRLE